MALYELNDREFATTLAALRYWQRHHAPRASETAGAIRSLPAARGGLLELDIACCGGELLPMQRDEIDALCEKMNTGERSPTPGSAGIWVLSTCNPDDSEPCWPQVFGTEAEAQAAFRDAMRGEWETNGPRDDDTDELLPMPDDMDEAHDAIAEAAGADWGRWQITSHVVDIPAIDERRAVAALRRAIPQLHEMSQLNLVHDEPDGDLPEVIAECEAALARVASASIGEGPAFLPDDGIVRATPPAAEPPIYGEGANVYLVRPLVDAWAIYELRVRGDTPEDARQQVKDNRSADKIWNWGEPELSELDNTDYEVWSLDEHGEMADVLIEA